jgi:glutathione S-transferase
MDGITLYQWPAIPGFQSSSPFCNKVYYALNYKRLPFESKILTGPEEVMRINRRGKLPALCWNDLTIVDSTDIVRLLEERCPSPSLYPSDPKLRSRALMIEDWADESLYWHLVYERWTVDEQVGQYLDLLFPGAPSMAREGIRSHIVSQLIGQGLGLCTLEEHRAQMATALDWIESIVESGFLCGPSPTVADIAVFAQIEALEASFTPFAAAEVRKRPQLSEWAARVRATVA